MRRIGLLFALFISRIPATAQQPAPDELIDHLVANAQLYAQTLPSLAATEQIDSQGSYLIFHRHVKATAVFRVLHPPGAQFEESRQITEADGKAVEPGRHVDLPSTLFGGFSRFQELFFTPRAPPLLPLYAAARTRPEGYPADRHRGAAGHDRRLQPARNHGTCTRRSRQPACGLPRAYRSRAGRD